MMLEMPSGKTFIGKLAHGCDLLAEITRICHEQCWTAGWLEGLGAVKKARVGFYDQATREYRHLDLDFPLEITHLVGNISLKEGVPFVHVHITFADNQGRAFGGHLAPGTIVFAGEIMIRPFASTALQRNLDAETGLFLWQEVASLA
ncbi:MAG: DNA-binding protein [Magnetococcales bacterium]|nr:DNA-binding protein [Magnetococcales bacterium]MBF0322618.1 DNA-binding protein [Magnetococcales bacterium]